MNTQTPIFTQHAEHLEWLNKLLFYTDDLMIMQNRLDEIAKKSKEPDVMKSVEHFQNQFKIQHEQIDILKHDINAHEHILFENVEHNPTASDHRKVPEHPEHRQKVERFEELFASLRKEFMNFAAKCM